MYQAPRHRLALALFVATLSSVPSLEAQFATKDTGGTVAFEAITGPSFDGNRALPVTFHWQPLLDPEETGYQAIAECRRRNRLGGPPGNAARVLFDLAMTEIHSGEEHGFGRRRRKLGHSGLQGTPAIWQSPDFEAIARNSSAEGVLVRFQISLRWAELRFGDTVTCECRITETGRRAIVAGAEPAAAVDP